MCHRASAGSFPARSRECVVENGGNNEMDPSSTQPTTQDAASVAEPSSGPVEAAMRDLSLTGEQEGTIPEDSESVDSSAAGGE